MSDSDKMFTEYDSGQSQSKRAKMTDDLTNDETNIAESALNTSKNTQGSMKQRKSLVSQPTESLMSANHLNDSEQERRASLENEVQSAKQNAEPSQQEADLPKLEAGVPEQAIVALKQENGVLKERLNQDAEKQRELQEKIDGLVEKLVTANEKLIACQAEVTDLKRQLNDQALLAFDNQALQEQQTTEFNQQLRQTLGEQQLRHRLNTKFAYLERSVEVQTNALQKQIDDAEAETWELKKKLIDEKEKSRVLTVQLAESDKERNERVEKLSNKGKDSFEMKNYDLALTYCSLAITAEKFRCGNKAKLAELWNCKGCCYYGLQKYSQTIKCYTTSLAYKANASCYYNRALAYFETKNFNKAVEDTKEALKLKPNFSLAKKLLKDVEEASR